MGYDIKDDAKPIIVKNNHSYNIKINKDYNSNVSCLPGSHVNRHSNEHKSYNQESRKHLTSDIFNTNNNYNSFNINNRKVSNRNYTQSFNEKKLIDDGRSKRPAHIRNVFDSQISIS